MKMRLKIPMICFMLTLCNLLMVTISENQVNNAENADKSSTAVLPVSNKNDLQLKLLGNQLQKINGDHKICAHLEFLRSDSTCNETLKQNKGTLENYSSLTERRCILVNDILNDVCHNSPNVPPNYIKSNISLCSRSVKMQLKENAPESVKIFFELWEHDIANCILTCYNNFKFESNLLCSLMVEYYTNTEIPDISSPKKEVENESKIDLRTDTKISKEANQVFQLEGNVQRVKFDQKATDDLEEAKDDENNLRNELKSSVLKNNNEILEKKSLPHRLSETVLNEDSHAFSYFFFISGVCVLFYLMMYNKKKILALIVEGRKRNIKRRPNSAAYNKLDSNLEEVMASGPSTSTSNTLLY